MTDQEKCLAALDAVAVGDWDHAHDLVQGSRSKEASWVHAHLHRVEGDLGNAGYWYARAGQPTANVDLESERAAIRATIS